MLNRNQASEMVKKYQENIKMENIINAKNLCENEISKEIEKKAKQGENSVPFSVPTNIDVNIVMEILVENGYKVRQMTYTYLRIEW